MYQDPALTFCHRAVSILKGYRSCENTLTALQPPPKHPLSKSLCSKRMRTCKHLQLRTDVNIN